MGPLQLLASAGGAALSGAARALAVVRRPAKPLHPHGDLVHGTVHRSGSSEPTGVRWLDEPGSDEVVVRLSRAIGLAAPLPDIYGIALRIPVERGHADLLLATTGLGRVTRFVLTPTRSPDGRPLTTLLPYRSPTGPLLLAAQPLGDAIFDLLWARPGGAWASFGRLVLSDEEGPDPTVSFDPLLNTLPGLENYSWVRRLRQPAYASARAQRSR